MSSVLINKQRVTLDPTNFIGKGGEAEVFRLGNEAVKIFKDMHHPDFLGDPSGQHAARERLAIHQLKLPAFPKGIPTNVIAPNLLAYKSTGQEIIGYTMPFLSGMEVLMRYGEKSFRQQGISNARVMEIFQKLHTTVSRVHAKGIVIGDFNDLNVLVGPNEPFLVDADSFQFQSGKTTFYCTTFMPKFVDPTLCDPNGSAPLLVQPHTEDSDWYAFAIMLFQCLLFVDPYGGVYKPKNIKDQVPHDRRPLKGITVFNPEVRYPKPAVPYGVLPDELLQRFEGMLVKNWRGNFPEELLRIQWTKCLNCGLEHARPTCPACGKPGAVKQTLQVRGTVTATEVFKTKGVILHATMQGGKLRWLYHQDRDFCRELGNSILIGNLEPGVRFRILGNNTFVAKDTRGGMVGNLATTVPFHCDTFGTLPCFDTNAKDFFYLSGGVLYRQGGLADVRIGDVLANRTLFWVGEKFGFGFYQAGTMNVAFVFEADHTGINDNVLLPAIKGQLLDSTCIFGQDRAWFFTSALEKGKEINRCHLIYSNGKVITSAEAENHSDHWLGRIRGNTAMAQFMLVATDEGVMRIEDCGTHLVVVKEFPDTEPFVDRASHLFAAPNGLYVVGQKEIRLLGIR